MAAIMTFLLMLLVMLPVLVVAAVATNEGDESSNPLLLPPALSEAHHHRSLQALQEGDTVQASILDSSCVYEDSFTDPRLECNITTRFVSPSSAAQVVDVTLDCASSSSTFPFRRVADACICSAMVTSDSSLTCSCAVCPQGVGANGIFVDCQDAFLIDTCSSVDCDYICNGPNVTDIITAPPTVSPTEGGGNPNNGDLMPTPTMNGSTPSPSLAAPRLGGLGCLFLFLSFGLAFFVVIT